MERIGIDDWIAAGEPPMLLEALRIQDPDELARRVSPETLRHLLGAPEPEDEVLLAAYLALPAPVRAWREGWPERCTDAATRALARRCASGEVARDAAVAEAARERGVAQARRAEVARCDAERARLGLGGGGDRVIERASRYLARVDGDSGGAWRAALALVRGWALDEGVALELLVREYAPRYHRRIDRAELAGMVRRAGRARNTGYGWLLA